MEQEINERKPLSKKMRFDVFKRDGFQCQYCGATPPSVVLEVDHIHPVSKGGKNRVDNLLTSCFECNRGKAAGLLTVAPQTVVEKAAVMAEKMDQLKAFDKLQRTKRKNEELAIDSIESAFRVHFKDSYFMTSFRESVRTFLQSMSVYEIENAMHRACSKINNREDAVKYFCGICWNVIKGSGYGAR